jgi:hypothetical protein
MVVVGADEVLDWSLKDAPEDAPEDYPTSLAELLTSPCVKLCIAKLLLKSAQVLRSLLRNHNFGFDLERYHHLPVQLSTHILGHLTAFELPDPWGT